jgi:hypothetical protein
MEAITTRLSVIAGILLLMLWAAVSVQAQESKIVPVAEQSLPDPVALLHAVQANQPKVEALVKNYIFKKSITEQETDKSGKVKKETVEEFECFYLGHDEVDRRLTKNGAPLSDSEQKKEQEKVDKQVREYKKRQEAGKANEQKKNELTLSSFLRCSRFVNPRRQQFRGKEVAVFDFEPAPNCNPANRAEKALVKVGGVIWIDEDAGQVVRMEARLIDGISVGLGILGSIQKGSELIFEQQKINDEVWLPSSAEIHYGARLLFKGMHGNIFAKYSDYRKFRVDTVIKPAEGTMPQ